MIKTLSLLAIFFYSSLTFSISSHTCSPEQYLTVTDTILCNLFVPLTRWQPFPFLYESISKSQSLYRMLMHTSTVNFITNTEAPKMVKGSQYGKTGSSKIYRICQQGLCNNHWFLCISAESGFSNWRENRQSQVKQFEDFILRANKYPTLSIFGGKDNLTAVKKIILVEVL